MSDKPQKSVKAAILAMSTMMRSERLFAKTKIFGRRSIYMNSIRREKCLGRGVKMGIFSVLNFFIIISFLFMGSFLLIGVGIGMADLFAYGTRALIDIAMFYLGIPVMFELLFMFCSMIISFIFYLFLSQKMSYWKLLLYIIYYVNWLFLSTIIVLLTLMTGGLILVFIFIFKKFFNIKDKTVWEILNRIPQELKNKAMRIKEASIIQNA